MTILLRRSVELTESEEGAVLLDATRGVYWHLNSVGAQFIRGIREGKPHGDVVDGIARDYSVDPETVRRDIDNLVKSLRKARLITVRDE